MGWMTVKQPNDKYAIFSSVVDHFILYDATREEFEAFIIEEETRRAKVMAERMLQSADEDHEEYTTRPREGDGLHRWRDCLKTIEARHGKREKVEVEKAIRTGDFSHFMRQVGEE